MIIDTSAILAVLFGVQDARLFENLIAQAWRRSMSEVTLAVDGPYSTYRSPAHSGTRWS